MPWQTGQSGNPGGLSKGSRRKLSDGFIGALARDWEVHGEEVIQRVREENPAAYVKGMLSLLPKDMSLEFPRDPTPNVSPSGALMEEVLRESEGHDSELVKVS